MIRPKPHCSSSFTANTGHPRIRWGAGQVVEADDELMIMEETTATAAAEGSASSRNAKRAHEEENGEPGSKRPK